MSSDRTDSSEATTNLGETAPAVESASPAVECCIDNLAPESRQAIEASEESVDIRYCLQRCGRCYKEPFFVVDGDVVTGTDHATLLETLESGGTHDA
ncbi:DUF1450 domain-containing protein [Haloglomus litoreum]|uniref:DUF1450 domain-containing protein n=1 Tax=Haloglomus litoreum TaxID=3034026 RepID=UPI0023E8A1DA|nr:DUF1450 domain-containing protein [Haloglomus sp. DT116]